MKHNPDRPTYLESLDDEKRATLLDMANLLRQDRCRIHSAQHSMRRTRSNEQPLKTTRPLDNTSLYMKSIWQLRHQLNALTIDHEATREKLQESETRCRALESELQSARSQYSTHMSTMAEQIEELISRSDTASRCAHLATQKQNRSEADRNETEENLSTLRSLLASDFARNDIVVAQEDARRHTRLLENLITPGLLEASQPPGDFIGSTPRQFTFQEFRSMELAMKQATSESKQLRNQLEVCKSRYEKLQQDHHDKIRLCEEQKAKLNQSLTGAARRIQWLVSEKQKLAASFRCLNEYSTRLEKKLLTQYEELQRLKGSKTMIRKSKAAIRKAPSSPIKTSGNSKERVVFDDSNQCDVEPRSTSLPSASKRPNATESNSLSILSLVRDQDYQKQVKSTDSCDSMLGEVPARSQFGLDRPKEASNNRPSLTELVRAAVEDDPDADN